MVIKQTLKVGTDSKPLGIFSWIQCAYTRENTMNNTKNYKILLIILPLILHSLFDCLFSNYSILIELMRYISAFYSCVYSTNTCPLMNSGYK